jgi:hypothetical protein
VCLSPRPVCSFSNRLRLAKVTTAENRCGPRWKAFFLAPPPPQQGTDPLKIKYATFGCWDMLICTVFAPPPSEALGQVRWLGAFAKLRNATISYVRMEQLSSHWTDVMKADIWGLKKNSRRFKFHWNRARITGTLHEDHKTFVIISRTIFFKSEIFQTKVVEEIKPHILYSITFSENRAVYKIIWKDITERGRLQMTI